MSSSCRRVDRPRRASAWCAVGLAACVGLLCGEARAALVSDQPAALIAYPYIVADATRGADTVLQISNNSNVAVDVQCFFEDSTSHCSDSGATCTAQAECAPTGSCDPGFTITGFRIQLTAQQPIGWRASTGRDLLPVGGQGTIPPLPEDPFVGGLRCFVVDASGLPLEANVLTGQATLEQLPVGGVRLDAAKYNAVGSLAVAGAVDADDVLTLGGATPEYEGCPNFNIMQHYFEGALEPVTGTSRIETTLVLVPCAANYIAQSPGSASVSYTVINEFGERFDSSQPLVVSGRFAGRLTAVDPTLFDVAVQGTSVGQTRFQGTGSGLMGLALEVQREIADPTLASSSARLLQAQGDRAEADTIRVAGTLTCGCDCNDDGIVDVAEVVNAIAISLGDNPIGLCLAADTDDSNTVGIDELVDGVNHILNGCP